MPEQIENRMVVDEEWEDLEQPKIRLSHRKMNSFRRILEQLESGDYGNDRDDE